MQTFHQFMLWIRRIATHPKHELKGAQRRLRYLMDLTRHCTRELLHDRAEQMAAALAYRTIFALVPLFVLGLVMFRLFGGFEDVQSGVQKQLYEFFGVPEVAYVDENFLPGERVLVEVPEPSEAIEREREQQGREAAGLPPSDRDALADKDDERQVRISIQRALTELTAKVANLNFASLGIIGVMLFFYAGMMLAVAVEQDCNTIFNSPSGRPWHLRLAIYWSIVTLGSGLLALSLYVSGQLVAWVAHFTVPYWVVWTISRLLALLASWILLFLLYSLMPNTKVRKRPALIGSFTAALLWEAGKIGFQVYVSRALPYSALYGSLGLIPLFLFWIYVSWLIMLFGLELTYTLQVMHGRVPEAAEEPQMELPGDPEWLIPILADIGRAFYKGETVGRQQLSERLGLPTRVVNEYGSQLQKAGIIHCVEATIGSDVSYTLARPPEQIAVADVLELGKQLSMRPHEPAFDVDWLYLDKLHEAELAAAGDATIASLIEGINGQPR